MNNLQELRSTLLAIHQRDIRQTITALIVAEVAALALLTLVLVNVLGNDVQLPLILYVMFGLMVIGPLIPYLIMLSQAKRRPARIHDFIDRLEKGDAVNNVNTYTDYKLILPLRLIRVRLFPMEYAQVILSQSRQAYKLPLSEENVQPFKAFVSKGSGGSVAGGWANN
ncbi:hypothetical protein [Chitinophaga vietnamensis]|uniref:hypothetical protein n=1 Tax=Chitinophaga vietnamensis TaxID=2593957 RepID=UPI0011786BAB|nr:hypothetical protein [Chitinophaga vietnamensis]